MENLQTVFAYKEFNQYCVQAIYTNLISLLSEYCDSEAFTKAPSKSDALIYYRSRVDKIEALVYQIYKNDDLIESLLAITQGIKLLVCTRDFPGLPITWYNINPNLRFYNVVFDVIKDYPQEYEKIKQGLFPMQFEYCPEESEIEESKQYFKKLDEENKEGNLNYTEKYWFQMELIKTVKKIFENLL